MGASFASVLMGCRATGNRLHFWRVEGLISHQEITRIFDMPRFERRRLRGDSRR
jgi:hypothetical protein